MKQICSMQGFLQISSSVCSMAWPAQYGEGLNPFPQRSHRSHKVHFQVEWQAVSSSGKNVVRSTPANSQTAECRIKFKNCS